MLAEATNAAVKKDRENMVRITELSKSNAAEQDTVGELGIFLLLILNVSFD